MQDGGAFRSRRASWARNAPKRDATLLAQYGKLGHAYGVAFQIRDDVLGIWASSDATGKVVANDIARRKWTYPVVWALAQTPSAATAAIGEAYAGGGELTSGQVERVVVGIG